ncbi:sensor histidine kinase [Variovorax sp. PBL-E5]|uniref:sensor histidine kinase n=1 Tax=Variovorax sp. PBL-E5 TaxID=434014 RepID=UPI001318FF6B|nr:HAMP domain-containing sensor histidine kinase [Variovorax sp. PBL-E5]VTU16407.1 Sensor kinase CusS [Variovorax sp. PBL-E5]
MVRIRILSLLGLYSEKAANVDIQEVMEGIGGEARRTIHLAESFMDMVEAESGVYRYALTFAGAAVLDAVDATWASASARGVTITPRLGAADCTISADASLLTRAFVNLLNNAIRYSESGSSIHVCLEANDEPGKVGGEVLISIRDEGAGMNAGQVAGLMDSGLRRKWNSTPSARDAGHGWGIGMTIVHAVVAHHGGWIDVMSAPAAGTTFVIGLPMATDDVQPDDDG